MDFWRFKGATLRTGVVATDFYIKTLRLKIAQRFVPRAGS